MHEIFIGILIVFITWLAAFFGNKYFIKRPKIALSIKDNYDGSSPSNKPKHLKIKWNKYFIIKNLTKNSAYHIQFYNLPKNIIIKNNSSSNLEGLTEKQIDFSFSEDIDEEKVITSKNRFVDLLPPYYRELSLGIEYENEFNKKFYTYFKKSNDVEQNKLLGFHHGCYPWTFHQQ